MRGWKLVLAAVAAAVIVMPAAAQGRRGFGGFGGPGALLGIPNVQKEIKLTEEQLKKYEEFNKGNESKRQEMREAFQNMDREKAQEIQKELAAATEKFIKDTLNADQSKRLKQISRQANGPNAFTDEETAKELKLTDEQKDGIKKIVEDLGSQSKEAFTGADFQDQEAMAALRKKVQGMRTEATEKITKMLTADQKKTWKDLTGDKFDLPPGGPGGFGKGKKGKAEE
jgi:Spy/CpxP family protein refolding chaperone